ncbi:MAG: lipopolysaccharide biosynthesis protein [Eubacteriales bacterium]|nr:lipopolysaccharide biosynthesis protein [Eubacteriales bacterium]
MITERNNIKKDYFWNTIGSGIYALASMVLAFAAMHILGPDDGGIFSFGFSAFGQQMFIIAYFGIRPFHITDSSYEYSYEEYRRLRLITSAMAVAAALVYLAFMKLTDHYSARKAAIIFLLALYKVADGIADLYESECQRAGLLWVGGKELALRTALSACTLVLAMLITKNVMAAAAAALLVQAAYIIYFRKYMAAHVLTGIHSSPQLNTAAVRELAQNTVLLFLSVFVDFYIFSASKYAIDIYLSDADSGVFNILFMPTSVIYLAANFIIKPYMTRMSEIYEKHDIKGFKETFGKLKIGVLGLSLLAMAGTVLLGKTVLFVLELILGPDYSGVLTGLATSFILIILGGCFYAVTNLYYYILIIMRRQKDIFRIYLIIAVLAALLSNIVVPRCGLPGAAAIYPIYMGFSTAAFALVCRKQLKREENEEEWLIR